MEKLYPCDCGECPYNAAYSRDCEWYCGLGHEEEPVDDMYEESEEGES